MTFIVTFVALLIERFFDWSHLRRWSWYIHFQKALALKMPDKSPYLILTLTSITVLTLVFILQNLLQPMLFGFIGLLFQLFIFLYCLGPQNLWADTFVCMNALTQGDKEFASEKIKTSFDITNINSTGSLNEQFLHQIFIAGNKRIFAIIFWFMILGPVGAVLYRIMTLPTVDNELTTIQKSESVESNNTHEKLNLASASRNVESLLNWVPVRLFTCIFALSGQFVQVFSCWRKKAIRGFDMNDQLLIECGVAALGKEDMETLTQDTSAGKNAISLLDRSFVITLVLMAIFMVR